MLPMIMDDMILTEVARSFNPRLQSKPSESTAKLTSKKRYLRMGAMRDSDAASIECTNAVVDNVSRAFFVFSLGSDRADMMTATMAEISGLRITLAMSWIVTEQDSTKASRSSIQTQPLTPNASLAAACTLGCVSVKHSHSLGTI